MRVVRHLGWDGIENEWDDLAHRLEAWPFLFPGWIRAWWSAFGRGRLQILTVRDGDRLVGVLPLRRRGKALRSPTNWHTPRFGPVVEDEAAARALSMGALSDRPWGVAVDYLDREDGPLWVFGDVARTAGYRVVLDPLPPSPFLRTDGGVEDWRRSIDADRRRELARRWRRLAERGSVAVELHSGPEELDGLLAEGFAVEGSGWKEERGTSIRSRPETLRFYRSVAHWAAERGWLRLVFLRLDGRPLAFDLSLEASGSHFLVKTGYDRAWARYAPGQLLRREMLERAFALRLRSYEFLGGAEPWKLQWTSTARMLLRFRAYRPSALGAAGWAMATARPWVRRAAAPIRRRGWRER